MPAAGPNLTDITYVGRQVVKFGAIALVVMVVGRTVLTTSIAVWKALNPEPPPPPTVGFGILPAVRFPAQADSELPAEYDLQLARGVFPSFGDRAKVFFMPKTSLGLLADQEARKIAASYDFVFEPEVLSSRIYRWRKSQPLETTFQLDIQSMQVKLATNYLSRPDLIGAGTLPDEFSATQTVKQFLGKADLLPQDVATAAGRVTYLKAVGTSLVEAVSYSDADFVQVDLNRTPVDGRYQMFTPFGSPGVISAILTGSFTGDENIVEFQYNYHTVESSEVHTYPLRTAQEAWQVLLSGGGYVAQGIDEDTAVVRGVTLGYYDDFEEQSYLQPIYVFSGDDGFLGYVSALDQRYVQSSTQN